MNKLNLFLLMVLIAGSVRAQNYVWSKGISGSPNVQQGCMATDASGNLYMAGFYTNSGDVDPGPGVYMLPATAGQSTFIVKLDANGNFVWSKSFTTATINDWVGLTDIAIDPAGNIYFSGQLKGTADLDPGAGIESRTGQDYDAFLLKLDSAGAFVYVKQMGGPGPDLAKALCLDAQGNVYLSGSFSNTADFDPSAATSNRTSLGDYDVFVAKYDGQGNLGWVNSRGSANDDNTFTLVSDANGSVFGTSTNPDTMTIFKIDANTGAFTWTKQIAGPVQGFQELRRLAVDTASGDVYATGNFGTMVDFDPGPGSSILTPTAAAQVFLLKLDNNGNFGWVRKMGAQTMANNARLGVFDKDHIYVTANYHTTADLDGGAGTYNVTATAGGLADVFVARYDSSGTFISGGTVGGPDDEYVSNVCFNSAGDLFVTGGFSDTADFDPGAGISLLGSPVIPAYSIYIMKLSSTLSVDELNGAAVDVHIYPNPTSGMVMIETGKSSFDNYSIVNSVGAQVGSGSLGGHNSSVDVSALLPGVYHLILNGKSGKVTGRVTKL